MINSGSFRKGISDVLALMLLHELPDSRRYLLVARVRRMYICMCIYIYIYTHIYMYCINVHDSNDYDNSNSNIRNTARHPLRTDSGGFDHGMRGWGGENVDQSLRVWSPRSNITFVYVCIYMYVYIYIYIYIHIVTYVCV